MGKSYKTYSTYKESEIPWVGSIPAAWAVRPAFTLVEESSLSNKEGRENYVLSLSYGRIIPRDVESNFGLLPESFNTYQIIDDGTIVLRLTDLQNDQRSLRVGRATQRGIITSAYTALKCKKIFDNRYAYYLLHSYDTSKAFYGMGGGLRQSMGFDDLKRLPLLIPTLAEQVSIIAFLEHETSKIDALIAKQRRLIELLQEKRQAVISRVVTKGLNSNAPMKDSREEWLGRIPQHWIVAKLNYRYTVELGKMLDEKRITGEHPVPYLRNQDVQWGSMNLLELPVMDIAPDEYERYTIQEGDLLVCEGGDIGRAAIVHDVKERYGFQKALHRLRPRNIAKDTTDFFYFVLVAAKEQGVFEENDTKATISHLPAEKFRQYRFAFPPLEEQQKIASFLRVQCTKLSNIITRARQGIALLQERRTALISAAVTGKIDVREWEPPKVQEEQGVEELVSG